VKCFFPTVFIFGAASTQNSTIQQNLKSINLSQNEAIDVAQNRPFLEILSTFGAAPS